MRRRRVVSDYPLGYAAPVRIPCTPLPASAQAEGRGHPPAPGPGAAFTTAEEERE